MTTIIYIRADLPGSGRGVPKWGAMCTYLCTRRGAIEQTMRQPKPPSKVSDTATARPAATPENGPVMRRTAVSATSARQNILFWTSATNRHYTIEAAPNGGYERHAGVLRTAARSRK